MLGEIEQREEMRRGKRRILSLIVKRRLQRGKGTRERKEIEKIRGKTWMSDEQFDSNIKGQNK